MSFKFNQVLIKLILIKGISKLLYICYDDFNWLDKIESISNYTLECVYNNVQSINIIEASLNYKRSVEARYWYDSNFGRIDCKNENKKWLDFKQNYTFTIQSACDNNTIRQPGYRRGATCYFLKSFLIEKFFRTQKSVIENGQIYPFPYSLAIRYVCY